MADKKISELPALPQDADADGVLLAVAYDGANYSVPLSALRDWVTDTTDCGDAEAGGDTPEEPEETEGGDASQEDA